jgi:outer membrane protein assembly factor BamB
MSRFILLPALLFTAVFLSRTSADDNWPQFRGPTAQGLSSATGLPLKWSETENVKWKTAIHDKAWSSPVVFGDRVWLTTATEDGRELYVVALDRESGKIVLDQKLFHVEAPQYADRFNSHGSPTPVAEDGRVYITFGSPGTACLDAKTGRHLGTARSPVQSLARRGFIADDLARFAHPSFRWGRLPVRCRTRQEGRENGLEN